MYWIVGLVLLLNLIAAVVIVFVERKTPVVAAAWLLVLSFLPVVGLIFFVWLGVDFPNKYKKTMTKLKKSEKHYKYILNQQTKILNRNPEIYSKDTVKECSDMIYMNLRQSFSFLVPGNKIEVFTNSEKFTSMFKDLENAKDSINIEYFIIKPDSTGKKLIEILAKKAKEGVSVKVIYDMFGSFGIKKSFFKPLVKNGGVVIPFFPSMLVNILNANYRNHRKIVVIDGKIAYTGGMNIADEYNGRWRINRSWRDTHIKIEGPAAYMYQTRFLMDYVVCDSKTKVLENDKELEKLFPLVVENGDVALQAVSSGPDTDDDYIKFAYIKMAIKAKKTLYIQTPYFIPDDSFLTVIKIAATSGVDVRVMIPDKGDNFFVHHTTLSYVDDLLRYGVKVYFYNGFLHSKTMVTDNLITSIGTANIDMRSFNLNFEINTIMYDENLAKKCNEMFLEDIKNCEEITFEQYSKRSKVKKGIESVCRLFSPIM